MEGLAFPLFVSVFWVSIACILLRIFKCAPYNFLCAFWMVLGSSGVILVDCIFSISGWPLNFFLCAVLVPGGVVFWQINFVKYLNYDQPEPLWGRFLFGGGLMLFSAIFAFSGIFFVEMLENIGSAMRFDQVLMLYIFLILTMGIAGVLIILKGKSEVDI